MTSDDVFTTTIDAFTDAASTEALTNRLLEHVRPRDVDVVWTTHETLLGRLLLAFRDDAVVRSGLVDAFGAEQLGGEQHLVERFGQAVHAPMMRRRSGIRQASPANPDRAASPPRGRHRTRRASVRLPSPTSPHAPGRYHHEAAVKLRC